MFRLIVEDKNNVDLESVVSSCGVEGYNELLTLEDALTLKKQMEEMHPHVKYTIYEKVIPERSHSAYQD